MNDGASLEIERCPVTLRLEGSAAGGNSRTDRALEGAYKANDASVAGEEEGRGVVGDRVPVRVDRNRCGGWFLDECVQWPP